ncbi:flagellar biosynthesis anti-sigma factor FlgM [Luminiphilus sp. nBUS_16]|uniref:flagellar biosynthesis anti-sigma factor FlgM n=1 Tax=Luminiphilus sp. nBUS_16 TaxID=3395315 RepID=UPI003EC135EE
MAPIDIAGSGGPSRIDNDRRAAGTRNEETRGTASEAPAAAVMGDDRVELTDTATRLNALADDVRAANGVDLEKVEAIRQRIADGDYEIDAGQIADALIRQEQELV